MSFEISLSNPEPVAAATRATRVYGRPRTFKDRLPGIIERTVEMVAVFGLAALLYLAITHFFFESVQVQGQSMFPTLRNADHYFLNRWAYHTHAPQRGDVIVIKDPTDGVLAVKRIIATAGECVWLKNGVVYINGSRLNEPYLGRAARTYASTKDGQQLILCGKDQYFVMGDNRGNSFDSRMYGPVPRANILGIINP